MHAIIDLQQPSNLKKPPKKPKSTPKTLNLQPSNLRNPPKKLSSLQSTPSNLLHTSNSLLWMKPHMMFPPLPPRTTMTFPRTMMMFPPLLPRTARRTTRVSPPMLLKMSLPKAQLLLSSPSELLLQQLRSFLPRQSTVIPLTIMPARLAAWYTRVQSPSASTQSTKHSQSTGFTSTWMTTFTPHSSIKRVPTCVNSDTTKVSQTTLLFTVTSNSLCVKRARLSSMISNHARSAMRTESQTSLVHLII